jgi:hypothetical protein
MYGVVYRSSGVVRVSSGVCESVWRGVSCLRNINSCIYRQVTPRSEFRTLMIMNDCYDLSNRNHAITRIFVWLGDQAMRLGPGGGGEGSGGGRETIMGGGAADHMCTFS